MAKKIVWKKLFGQDKIKTVLGLAFENKTLGHAYLLSGEAGAGKFAAALDLSMALHCENEESVPCYNCSSCRKILENNDPDFRVIFPVSLAPSEKDKGGDGISESGWKKISENILFRVNNPYEIFDVGLSNIPVDWIREATSAINRGSITGKINITIICDVDTMKKNSANAMLKTLEEPPANTLFLLLTSRFSNVLPTIKSRCQNLRFGAVDTSVIEKGLLSEFGENVDNVKVQDAALYSLGYYGKARDIYINSDVQSSYDVYKDILRYCQSKQVSFDLIAFLEDINSEIFGNGSQKVEATKFYKDFLHIFRSVFFKKNTGTENYIYKRCFSVDPLDLNININSLSKLIDSCENAIRGVNLRSGTMMVLINFVLSIMEILNEQK